MLILDLPNGKGEGQNLRVATLGSCRARDLVFNAYPDEEEAKLLNRGSVLDTAWFKFCAFTHNPQQALQYHRIISGSSKIPEVLEAAVFNRPLTERDREMFADVRNDFIATVDVFVVEISTLNNFECNDMHFNQNYLERNLVRVGGKPMLKWLRSMTEQSDDHEKNIDAIVNALPLGGLDDCIEIIDIIKNCKRTIMSESQLWDSIEKLMTEVNAPVVFVVPPNIPDEVIASRAVISEYLNNSHEEYGYHVYDPTRLVEKYGREMALAGDGADVNHYKPRIHEKLVQDFVPFLKDAYRISSKGLCTKSTAFVRADQVDSMPEIRKFHFQDITMSREEDSVADSCKTVLKLQFHKSEINPAAGIGIDISGDQNQRTSLARLSFSARSTTEKSKLGFRVFTGSRYERVEGVVSTNYQEFEIETDFKLVSSSPFRIAFENPAADECVYISNIRFELSEESTEVQDIPHTIRASAA